VFVALQSLPPVLVMDSDSEDGDLMPIVFAVDVDADDLDFAVPPTSGQEYLRRVMWVLLSDPY